jgi:hypothetical protein
VDQKLYRETERQSKSSELWKKCNVINLFEIEFGQNVHQRSPSMKTKSLVMRHSNHRCKVQDAFQKIQQPLDCSFKGSPVDPCLWRKYSEFRIKIVAVYADDYCCKHQKNQQYD